jgi:hypothetical protein
VVMLWESAETDEVVKRLRQFIDLGFRFSDTVIRDTIKLFEHRLQDFKFN